MGARTKKTKIELELLTDANIIRYYKNGIRGGIKRAICRYIEANDKYMYDYEGTKVYACNILILTINTGWCCHSLFLMLDLNMLNMLQCLHPTLL